MYLRKSLLMGPIINCDFEMIAVLLLNGADPFALIKTFISGPSGEKELRQGVPWNSVSCIPTMPLVPL